MDMFIILVVAMVSRLSTLIKMHTLQMCNVFVYQLYFDKGEKNIRNEWKDITTDPRTLSNFKELLQTVLHI